MEEESRVRLLMIETCFVDISQRQQMFCNILDNPIKGLSQRTFLTQISISSPLRNTTDSQYLFTEGMNKHE